MKKIFIITLFNLFPLLMFSNNNTDWTKVINAIIQVESNGNEKAVSKCGNCVGIMQIKKIVVDDCNEYLSIKKSKKERFTYDDRYNKEKSIEMFLLIQERYNKGNDIEQAIKIWNGGCGYKQYPKLLKQANEYYIKVMKAYEKL